MNDYFAFIDESGNHDLDTSKDGASSYFLILAILVSAEHASTLANEIEKIRLKYFGLGEIKSSSTKDKKRSEIISELKLLDFRFYALAIDKKRISKDTGLKYKKSFIKFTNGILYEKLFRAAENLTIYADGHGSSEFMESFEKYINENHGPDLFSTSKIEMVDSRNNVMVQLADFLVGTVAKVYENKATGEAKKNFLEFLRQKRISIDEWPPHFEIDPLGTAVSDEVDSEISKISLRTASHFLKENIDNYDTEVAIQHATLSYLLFQARFPMLEKFTTTNEILEHLSEQGFNGITKQYLRSNVIAKLRDHDVIIASSTKGYKIPTTYSDITGFADLVDGITMPLLGRLKKADELFALGSAGKIKVLDEQRFKSLKNLVDNII
ncbi:DUF3800 domain-containing protein [Janthinobacterium aquaticum]|uniref:DUF3800 domain-containing protein n=1 Tax=Janthinobacterium sp. FT58W TaxID=2654254 RepID=UPI00186AD3CD|nr:DUF3800 domain-containing protein [Janthinobacterium sp. FT58W]